MGGTLEEKNLGWSEHLQSEEGAFIPKLRQQLGALKLIADKLPQKSRLTLANGILLSKICYLIQIWGAAHKNKIKKVQTILNCAARFVTRSHKRISSKKLKKLCNWLNVTELIEQHSLVSMWKIVNLNIPTAIREHIAVNEENKLTTRPPRLKTVAKSFKHRTIKSWNNLPELIRMTKNIKT